jgi:DNA-binding beta-propeller fold protein YncE
MQKNTEQIFGSKEFRFKLKEDWAKWPEDWTLGDCAAVGVDSKDNVYAFHRGEHPVVVFDRDGNVMKTWGEGIFVRPHGIHVGPDDYIYLTDDNDQTVRKCTVDGKVLLTIGVPGRKAAYMGGEPFRYCTHTALSPQGDIYVSDGYGNARIHKYTPNGSHILSWGEPGSSPGQFNLPHNIHCDANGWVYVADRENHRIQVFDGNGKFETQWHNLHRPSGMFMPAGKCPVCYVGEIGPYYDFNRGAPNLGPRISVLSNEGELLSRIEGTPNQGTGPGQFTSPHGLAVDSKGDLYVAEVAYTAWPKLFPDVIQPNRLRILQKFEKIAI